MRPPRAGDASAARAARLRSAERIQRDVGLLRIAVVDEGLVVPDVVEGERVGLAVGHLRVDGAGVLVGHRVLVEAGRARVRLVGVGQQRGAVVTGAEPPRVVVFCDEIEKAFAGTGTDTSGTKTEMTGTLLSWMQDREADGAIFIDESG